MTADKQKRLKMAMYKHTGQGYGRRRGTGNGLEPGIRYRLDKHTGREDGGLKRKQPFKS